MPAITQSRVYTVLAASVTPGDDGARDLRVHTAGGALLLRFPRALARSLVVTNPAAEDAASAAVRMPRYTKHAERTARYLRAIVDGQRQGLTQRQIAGALGVHEITISQWRRRHAAEVAAALAAAPVSP